MDNYLNPEQKGMRDAVEKMQVILDCPLCEAHGLHVIGKGQIETRQCLNCGYASSPKFIGDKLTNEEFPKLPDEMKRWSVEEEGRIWIPSIITLPFGMLYPENDNDGNMIWKLAFMIDISDKEKENYPNPEGGYYERRIDTENAKVYEKFVDGMLFLSEKVKKETTVTDKYTHSKEEKTKTEFVLPKIKRL